MKTLLIGYCRVSTGAQADGLSLDTQRETIEAHAARHGHTVAAIYSDTLSGSLYESRKGLQDALAHIERLRAQGEPAALIVAKWDRAGRELGAFAAIERRLSLCGGGIISCDGTPGGDSAAEGLMRGVTSVVSSFERARIRERTIEGKLEQALQGRQPARAYDPLGYHIVRRSEVYPGSAYRTEDIGHYVLVPEQLPLVQEIWKRAMAGESNRSIARAMESAGYKTAKGGAWCGSGIGDILKNPTYKGEAPYGQAAHIRIESEGRVRTIRSRSESVVYIPCPAIVTAAQWELVQQRVRTNQRIGNPTRRALLSGLVRCPECGRGLYLTRMVRGYYYMCDGGRQQPVTCSRRRWHGPELERLVVSVVSEIGQSPAVVAAVLAAATSARPSVDLRALERAAEAASRAETAAVVAEVEARAAGRDASAYAQVVKAATARRQEAERALQEAQGQPKAQGIDTAALVRACALIGPMLADESEPVATRSLLLRQIVQQAVPYETGEVPTDRRRSPSPGALVTLISPDSAGVMVIRAALSGDGVIVEVVRE